MRHLSDIERFNAQFEPDDLECRRCHGTGQIHWLKLAVHGPEVDTDENGFVECPRCHGTGNTP